MLSKQSFFYICWGLISTLFIVIALYFDGTGGNGDSVFHYLYARYAWEDYSLFFNHWAKPLFTMVSSPFAQFGFTGIKIFNVLASSFSVLFAYKIAKIFNLKYAHLIFIPLFAAPLFFRVMFSGLTEPFSAFLLTAFILLWLTNNRNWAIILISFVPFVRSEGLILLGVILVYLVWTKNWRYTPLLFVGHLIISLLGLAYYNDILWVFNKIPYAKLSSVYGDGNWTHFINQLYFCLGPITYLLLIIGLLKIVSELFLTNRKTAYFNERLFLVYGIFLAFFVSHTTFWVLGIFNSMGLNRVFVTVFPLIGIISIEGLDWLTKLLPHRTEKTVVSILLLITIVFTCLHNPASIDFKNDLNLDAGQKLVKKEIVPYLNSKFENKIYMTGDLSFALYSNRNIFNPNECLLLYDKKPQLLEDTNFVFIWDPWFAPIEGNLNLEELKKSDRLKVDTVFKTLGTKKDTLEYILFRRK